MICKFSMPSGMNSTVKCHARLDDMLANNTDKENNTFAADMGSFVYLLA